MIVEYTRYRIGEARSQAFIDAHGRATRYLHFRCLRYELSRRSDNREWFTLRIEWASSEELRCFHKDVDSEAFRQAMHAFEGDIQEHWQSEVTDVVHHSVASERRCLEELCPLPDRDPWNRLSPWILEHLHEKILVEEMAEQVHMSPRNFARVFRRELRIPPGEFLDRIRVAAARNDLEEGQQSIDQIANARGFGTSSTMRRAFLRIVGVTPSEYRQTSRRHADASLSAEIAFVPSDDVLLPMQDSFVQRLPLPSVSRVGLDWH